MYFLLVSTLIVFQLAAPIGLIVWLAIGQQSSLLHYLTQAVSIGAFILFLFLSNRWDMVGYLLRYAIPASFAGVVVLGLIRHWSKPNIRFATAGDFLRLLFYVAVGAFFLVMTVQTVRSFVHRGSAIDLFFPLQGIEWYVGQGGSSFWLNSHYNVEAQSYALDVVALGAFGLRASGILPKRLEAYAVFDQPVRAPCGGRVVSVADGHPDLPPPKRDRINIAGNFVAIACNDIDATVFLGHLRQGSVVPARNSVVARGEQIGRVGNSGNTTEPHLHIHAVRGVEVELKRLLRDARPVPMRFQGRFLVRNDRRVS
jgi:hypothetical protein